MGEDQEDMMRQVGGGGLEVYLVDGDGGWLESADKYSKTSVNWSSGSNSVSTVSLVKKSETEVLSSVIVS